MTEPADNGYAHGPLRFLTEEQARENARAVVERAWREGHISVHVRPLEEILRESEEWAGRWAEYAKQEEAPPC